MKRTVCFVCLLAALVLLTGYACATAPDPTGNEASALLEHLFQTGTLHTPEPTPVPTRKPTPKPRPTPPPTPTPSPTPKPAAVLPGKTDGYSLIIDDRIDLLTDQEEQQLAKAMEPITQYGTVAFVTTDEVGDTNDEAMAYSIQYINPSRSYNSTLLMIDMNPRTIYLFSRGALEHPLNRSVAFDITSAVSSYASDGDYFACANAAFGKIQDSLNGTFRYSWLRLIGLGLLSAAVGLLISYLVHRMAGIQKRANPEEETRRLNITLKVNRMEPGEGKVIAVEHKRINRYIGGSCSSGSFGSSCSSGGSSGGSSGSSCGSGGGSSF